MDYLKLEPGKRIYFENSLPKIGGNCTEGLALELIEQRRMQWNADQNAFADLWIATRQKIRNVEEKERREAEKEELLNSRAKKWFRSYVRDLGKEGKTLKDSRIEPVFHKLRNIRRLIDEE